MPANIRKSLNGIGIIPTGSLASDIMGELEVDINTGKLNHYNGSSRSPVVTEAHSATLTNKTLTSPTINDATLSIADNGHSLSITGSNTSTADRTLTINMNDAARTISLSGTLTVSNAATISGTNTGDQTITLTSDVTGSGTGSFATTIAANAVTYAKFQQVAGLSVVGVTGTSTANSAAITGTTDQVLRVNSAGTGLAFGAINLASASAVSGTLPIGNGGTGQTSATNAFNALAPATAKGGVIVGSGSNTYTNVAVGTDGQVLVANSGATNGAAWTTLQQGAKNYITYNNFENNASTGWNWANVGTLTNGIPTGTPNFTSVNANPFYSFTISTSTTCAVGDTYTNNSQTFTVVTALSAQSGTVFFATGTGDPTASGTLTRASGAGTSSITFSAFTKETFSIVSSGQLAGTYSLSVATSGATVASLGFCSNAYTIDAEDQAKVLTWKFYYSANSGASNANFSGTSSNSFGVAVYDVTNSVWLGTAGQFSMVQSTGVGYSTGTFQTGATTASIRFVIYNVTATSGAVTMYFDDFYVGPQTAPMGPAMTDWVSFTPTGAWSTNTTYTGQWKRVGDRGYYKVKVALSGAPDVAGLTVNMPTGQVIDTTKLVLASSTYCNLGTLQVVQNSSGDDWKGGIRYNNTTLVSAVYWAQQTSPNNHIDSNTVNKTTPVAFANLDTIVLEWDAPIVGWSSNTAMSNDTDTRVVQFLGTGGTATLTSSYSDVTLTATQDTHGSYSGATYTIPVTGYYKFLANARFSSNTTITATNAIGLQLTKNGSAITNAVVNDVFLTASAQWTYLSYGDNFKAGDTIKLQAKNQNSQPIFGTTPTLYIARESGPAVVAATESVNAKYYGATATITSSMSNITFSTKDYDSHAGMATTTYTIPVSGKYDFIGAIFFNATTITAGNFVATQVLKNGSAVNGGSYEWNFEGTSVSNAITVPVAAPGVNCNAGDTITFQVQSNATSTPVISASNNYNFMTIKRVGN